MEPVISGSVEVYPDSTRFALIVLGMLFSGIAFWIGIGRIGSSQRKEGQQDDASQPSPTLAEEEWNALCARAGAVVERTIAELPREVAAIANKIPCLFKEHAEKESPGYRTMGVFQHFTPGKTSDFNGPIILYLKSIEEISTRHRKSFEEQVRYAYLHELGHGLGWDEVDLIRHGLPSGKPPAG